MVTFRQGQEQFYKNISNDGEEKFKWICLKPVWAWLRENCKTCPTNHSSSTLFATHLHITYSPTPPPHPVWHATTLCVTFGLSLQHKKSYMLSFDIHSLKMAPFVASQYQGLCSTPGLYFYFHKMYRPLCRPSFSSCRRLWPSPKYFSPLQAKQNKCLPDVFGFLAIFGIE